MPSLPSLPSGEPLRIVVRICDVVSQIFSTTLTILRFCLGNNKNTANMFFSDNYDKSRKYFDTFLFIAFQAYLLHPYAREADSHAASRVLKSLRQLIQATRQSTSFRLHNENNIRMALLYLIISRVVVCWTMSVKCTIEC